jgi:hypothetical protein
MLLLTFPVLKQQHGPVGDALKANAATEDVMQTWRDLVAQQLVEPDDAAEFE